MSSTQDLQLELQPFEPPVRTDPRADMSVRLPAAVQPFPTWPTKKPAPREEAKARTSTSYVVPAIALTLGGCALSSLALPILSIHRLLAWAFLPTGLIATSSGLGLFQACIFHHCAHGTVFKAQKLNRMAGRLISAILLFKYFDSYRHEHMLHHNAAQLFTLEDEFTDFIANICNFSSSLSRSELWLRLVILLISPVLMEFRQTLSAAMIKAGLRRWVNPVFNPHVTLSYDDSDVPEQKIEPISWPLANSP